MSSIELTIKPRAKDLGDDFVVRRALPHGRKPMVGPFIFWDHMGPVELSGDKEMKVRAHPHIGLATITYLFSGEIMHRDNLENEQAIRPGEVNWMTAGRGIAHSERAKPQTATTLEGIQLWVALPTVCEDIDPSFVHKKETELPMIDVEGAQLRLIAGEFLSNKSPLPTYSPLFYLNGKVSEGSSWSHTLESDQEAALYMISGEVEVEQQRFSKYDMVVFKQGSQIEMQAQQRSEFMFFGGQPFPEKRHIWWNFVSSDPAKIEKAKVEWKEDRFGPVINETERIPLPEK